MSVDKKVIASAGMKTQILKRELILAESSTKQRSKGIEMKWYAASSSIPRQKEDIYLDCGWNAVPIKAF